MVKAQTVEQYQIIKWLEQNFYIEALKISLIDKATVLIEDMNGEAATVRYKGENDIMLEYESKLNRESEQSA